MQRNQEVRMEQMEGKLSSCQNCHAISSKVAEMTGRSCMLPKSRDVVDGFWRGPVIAALAFSLAGPPCAE